MRRHALFVSIFERLGSGYRLLAFPEKAVAWRVMNKRAKWNWLGFGGLILVIAVIAGVMQQVRHQALVTYTQPGEQEAWEAWREKAATDAGPVSRRIPKSAEPPALVLFRDYYAVVFLGAEIFAVALYAALLLLLRGVALAPSPQIDLRREPRPERP